MKTFLFCIEYDCANVQMCMPPPALNKIGLHFTIAHTQNNSDNKYTDIDISNYFCYLIRKKMLPILCCFTDHIHNFSVYYM